MECCFDRSNGYRLVETTELERENRLQDAVPLPAIQTTDDGEMDALLDLLPDHLARELREHRHELVEVVLDVGRRPVAWMAHGRRKFLGKSTENNNDDGDDRASSSSPFVVVTQELLDSVCATLQFGADNRAGLDGSLHRISALRNRDGHIVGLTLRAGRFLPGNALLMADLLYGSTASILLVGPPGSGKTSIVRDAARLLAAADDGDNDDDDEGDCNSTATATGSGSVVIVDTSCEIGGAGNVPHEGIGLARRMQVPSVHAQAHVMVECIQNHTPGVLIIDEISRAAEVQAALTCKERGVRVVASAHGNLAGLVRNAQLCDLVGGVDVVTISDEYARQDAQRHHIIIRQREEVRRRWRTSPSCARSGEDRPFLTW